MINVKKTSIILLRCFIMQACISSSANRNGDLSDAMEKSYEGFKNDIFSPLLYLQLRLTLNFLMSR
jgi:hypothetical protein